MGGATPKAKAVTLRHRRRGRHRSVWCRAACRTAPCALLLSALVARAAAPNWHAYVPVSGAQTLVVFETATQARIAEVALGEAGLGTPLDIALTPDGSVAYVTTGTQVVAINTTTRLVAAEILIPDSDWATRLVMSRDGRFVLASGYDRHLFVIDTATHHLARSLSPGVHGPGGGGQMGGLALSADGREAYVTISYTNEDDDDVGHLFVVDTLSGAVRRDRIVGGYGSEVVAVAPDGTSAYVTPGYPGGLVVVDSSSLDTVATIRTGGNVVGIAFSPDGRLAYAASATPYAEPAYAETDFSVIDTRTHAVVSATRLAGRAGRLAVTPDGGTVYVPIADAVGRVVAIDAGSGAVVGSIDVGERPEAVAIAPVARPVATRTPTPRATPRAPRGRVEICAYVAEAGGAMSVLNVAAGEAVRSIRVGGERIDPDGGWQAEVVRGIALAPDGTRLYATMTPFGGAGAVALIDVATTDVIDRIPVGCHPGVIAIHPDGAVAYVGQRSCSASGSVAAVDLRANRLLDAFPLPGEPLNIAFAPDGARAYVTHRYGSTVTIVDAAAHAVLGSIKLTPEGARNRHAIGLAVAPHGDAVYVGTDQDYTDPAGHLVAIDPATNAIVRRTLLPVAGVPETIAVAPDGSRVYVAIKRSSGAIGVFDAGGEWLATLPIGPVSAVALSPDGEFAYATQPWLSAVAVVGLKPYWILPPVTVPSASSALAVGRARRGCPRSAHPLASRTPTPTRSPAPTLTPRPTPVPQSCDEPCAALRLSDARGFPGQRVTIEARLHTAGLLVARFKHAIVPPLAAWIAEGREDQPDCTVNADLHKDASTFIFRPQRCRPGRNCTDVRVEVKSSSRDEPIPDGAVVYRCQFDISPDAAPGTYPVYAGSVGARDPGGAPVRAVGVNAIVEVLVLDRSNDAPARGGASGGCHIARDGTSGLPITLLLSLLAALYAACRVGRLCGSSGGPVEFPRSGVERVARIARRIKR